jgi:hypothetical protein
MRTERAVVQACAVLLLSWSAAAAQQAAPAAAAKSPEWLVKAAVLAAPAPLRDGAEVRAVGEKEQLTVLRPGTNGIICLADLADDEAFSAACYHASLEPFMARGRQLRQEGIAGAKRDEMRWKEIEAGTLAMPMSAVVYNLRLPSDAFDPATLDPATGGRLHSVYIRGATTESTGLPSQPLDGPWLMNAGTPSAHIMISLPAKKQ